jgi:hypothetical protein
MNTDRLNAIIAITGITVSTEDKNALVSYLASNPQTAENFEAAAKTANSSKVMVIMTSSSLVAGIVFLPVASAVGAGGLFGGALIGTALYSLKAGIEYFRTRFQIDAVTNAALSEYEK